MAANVAPVDPLSQLSAALAAPADSQQQADLLATLRESLENHPSLSILCSTLIKTLSGAGDSLVKRWVLDLLHYAICKSNLSMEARTQCELYCLVNMTRERTGMLTHGLLTRFDSFLVADQSLETLFGLLGDLNVNTAKVTVQCFPTVYALLFRTS